MTEEDKRAAEEDMEPSEKFEPMRCAVEVFGGILPGQLEEDLTRRWFILSKDWNENPDQAIQLIELAGKANAYATYLMLQPDRLNWVKTEWIWF